MKDDKRVFKYYPEDFGQLTVKVLHMDLDFDVHEDQTRVHSDLKVKALEIITELDLNAKNLEIHSVDCDLCNVEHVYDKDNDLLKIKFSEPVEKGTVFTIHTQTTCKPTNNILEGIYYDETPKGCPCTQITQCQQWGFQRIVPCIDDMTAKCTYQTTIHADARYTNIISNGDLTKLDHDAEGNRVSATYDNTKVPMATYLFFLGVGTYDTYTRDLTYPDGHTVTLELLALVGSDRDRSKKAIDILHDAVMWTYLFTGKDKYKNEKVAQELWQLIKEREQLKSENNEYQSVQNKIKTLAEPHHWGYKYTGKVYREIAMQNSDFGGMENVGNTTITANRIMPFEDMTDPNFEYMTRVKAHEFYHNLNGSEVTGRSPFEIWLNEAVTVHIERENHSFNFGEEYARLSEVLSIISPDGGVLQKDAGTASMPIEPDGFNDTNELITGITYVKAPEFVRMVQTLLGEEDFVKALDLYHTRYHHSNATRAQWIECMEEVSGLDLQSMAQVWLKKTKYPVIDVEANYNEQNKTYTVTLTQTNVKDNEEPWQFPFVVGLFKNGILIEEKTAFIQSAKEHIDFENVEQQPDFVSLNRGLSVYAKVKCVAPKSELLLQAHQDTDAVARYMAYYTLFDREKTALLEGSKHEVDSDLVELFMETLADEKRVAQTGGHHLTLFESVEDERYMHNYKAVYEVKNTILKTIAKKHKEKLLDMYTKYDSKVAEGEYLEKEVQLIKYRQIKNIALSVLAKLDTPDIHELIKKQIDESKSASEKVAAFRLYLNTSAPDKLDVLETYEKRATQNQVAWEAFLQSVALNASEDAISIMKRVEDSEHFRIEQTNHQRGLYLVFAYNNKKLSLMTDEGIEYYKQILLKLAPINEYTTGLIMGSLGNLDLMEEEWQVKLVGVAKDVLETLNPKNNPSVYNTLKRMITNSPKAVARYEKIHGKIKALE